MKKNNVIIVMITSLILLASCKNDIANNLMEQTMDEPSDVERMNDEVTENETGDETLTILRDAITEVDFIQAKGKNLYTNYGEGELIQLKGLNVGGYLFQEFWMTPTKRSENIIDDWSLYQYLATMYGEETMRELIGIYQDNYFTEDDFDRCAEMGINLIRLPFWYLNIVDFDGEILEDWYIRFDWFIEEAGKRGIYVMLDFHGAPGSQNGSDHSGIDGEDDKEGASKFFFGDEAEVAMNQELYYTIWEVIANRYKDNPVVAGYDLLNEPFCTYRYDTDKSSTELHNILWPVYDTAYQRIRAIDPDHLIIMEATWDPVDLPNPEVYGWENVMYQYHNYLFDHINNEDNKQILSMQNKLNLIQAANYNVPSFMGEFNYMNQLGTWDAGLSLLNQEGISWAVWTYKNLGSNGNWGFYKHSSAQVNLEVLDEEKIRIIWEKVGEVSANNGLIDIMREHCFQPYVSFE